VGAEPIRWDVGGERHGQLPLFGPEHRELASVEYLPVVARRIVNRVPERSRMPFRFTINAYRGCRHACTYCFARPTHEYLGMGIGEDFERRIVVKVNAVERLRLELADPSWPGEEIAMGTNTDPYQPAEGRYRLTRGLIEVLTERANPFSILTKSSMIIRDLELLVEAARVTEVGVALSIGSVDDELASRTEPGAAPPSQRLEAVAKLADAGLRPSVLVAPVLPGLSDSEESLRAVARACAEAGARNVVPIVLHLRPGVREHYLQWLAGEHPELLDEHLSRYDGRAYLPRTDGQRVALVVREEFDRARTRSGSRRSRKRRSWVTTSSVPA
jgi:DNA repair photolyase